MSSKKSKVFSTSDYSDLYMTYPALKKISFDYAVVEHETSIRVMYYFGEWKDFGTWNTLIEVMEESVIGQGTLGDHCENAHIVYELNIPILAIGLKNAVISASKEGIFVSDRGQSSLYQAVCGRF